MEELTTQTKKIKVSFFMILIFILTFVVLLFRMGMTYSDNSGLISFGVPLLVAIISAFLVKLSSKVKLRNDAQNITFKKNPIILILLWTIFAVLSGFLLFYIAPIFYLFLFLLGH
jgi:hypothetical protein